MLTPHPAALSLGLLALAGGISAIPMPQATPAPSTSAPPMLKTQGVGVPVTDIPGQAEAFTAASRLATAINQTAPLANPTISIGSTRTFTDTFVVSGSTLTTSGSNPEVTMQCPTGMVYISGGGKPACCPGVYYDGQCHRTDTAPLPAYTGPQPVDVGLGPTASPNGALGRSTDLADLRLVGMTACLSVLLGAFLV